MTRGLTFIARALAIALAIAALDASALAPRTFVGSHGVDTNACSLAAPCRSFAAALAQTNGGGEIVVLDSAGYGHVTIDKSVTITAPAGIYAGITVPAGFDGVLVETPGIDVVLRGLTINGQGGFSGVNFFIGASLVVEDCTISGMGAAGLSLTAANGSVSVRNVALRSNTTAGIFVGNGVAIDVAVDRATIEHNASGIVMQSGARVNVRDSAIRLNLNGVTVMPNILGPAPFARLTLTRTSVEANSGPGVVMQSIFGIEAIASIADSEIARNTADGVNVTSSGTAVLSLSNSRVHDNSGNGITLANSGGTVRGALLSDTITRNGGIGMLVLGGATAVSNGANLIKHNLGAADVSGTITPGAI